MCLAQMFDERPSQDYDDDNNAFGYGEHRQRDRFFSAFDVGSQDGDESMDHGYEDMITMTMQADHEPAQLDQEDKVEFNSLLTEIKKPEQLNHPIIIVDVQQHEPSSDVEEDEIENEDGDDSCGGCNTSKHDNALDETKHSLHMEDVTFDFHDAGIFENIDDSIN